MTAEPRTSHRQNSRCQQGYTLVEIIVSVVVFGILIVLMIAAFVPNVSRGADPLFSVRAAELGQSYLDEILGKRFAENSPSGNGLRCGEAGGPGACGALGADTGETTQSAFDDVDDYIDLPSTPIRDSSGNPRSGYEDFSVQIAVANAGTDIGVNAGDAKRITVTVMTPNGGTFLFAAYKANF